MIEEFQFQAGKWRLSVIGPGGGVLGAFKFDAEAPNLQICRLLDGIGDKRRGIRTVTDLPPGWSVTFVRLADDEQL